MRRAIRRAGKAMRQPPILERTRRPADGGVPMSARTSHRGLRTRPRLSSHWTFAFAFAAYVSNSAQQRIEDEDHPHRGEHQGAGEEGEEAARQIVGGDVDDGVENPRRHEEPGEHDQSQRRLRREEGEDDDEVEENRQLELVLKRIGDLGDVRRPVELAERNIAAVDGSAGDRPESAEFPTRRAARRSAPPVRTGARAPPEHRSSCPLFPSAP